MTQQALRREDEQWERVLLEELGLPAQQVKVLRGRRAVHEPQVDSGGRLQNALGPGTRMLRTLSLVSVREQKHERRLKSPLGASRGHELIEDDVRAVDEVAVLRFPEDEMRRLLDVVAELEPDGPVFAERTVVDFERRPGLIEGLQRNEAAAIRRVVEHRMATAERTALDILPRQPDGDAVRDDGREGELLGSAPIDRSFGRVVEHRLAPLAAALEFLVEREALRRCLQGFVDFAQTLDRDARISLRSRSCRRQLRHRRDVILLGLE